MTTKTITILGKDVTLGYCNATEIGYKLLSDEEISDFVAHVITCLEGKKEPDKQKTIYLIIAAVKAYSEWKEVPATITDRELLYDAAPMETAVALGTILQLRADFYHLPSGEQTGDESDGGDEPKNA